METRYFTGFLRDHAQKGRRGDLSDAARTLLHYVRSSADVAGSLRIRVRADLAQGRIDVARHDRLLAMLDMLTQAWKRTDQIVDVRDARDWRACGNGHQHVSHHEIAIEDDPVAFGITAPIDR
jgi:hypothetical protein